MSENAARQNIQVFLAQYGVGSNFALELLKGGRNNRVYKVNAGRQKLVLKEYFCHPGDMRNRCRTEFEFSTFAWGQGVRSIPKPLQCSTGLALYDYKEGRSPSTSDVGESFIWQAVELLHGLNRIGTQDSSLLHDASEACFSIAEHIQCVDARVERLSNAVTNSGSDLTEQFVEQRLMPAWKLVQDRVRVATVLNVDRRIAAKDRILSPSDFGFHNAILTPDGSLAFFDFEYAGWDDPAKTICDFFLQPAVPVSLEYLPLFLNRLFPQDDNLRIVQMRAAALFPLYQIKWCCILLNEFLPVESSRRKFALGSGAEEQGRMHQLALATNLLEQIERADWKNRIRNLHDYYNIRSAF